MTTPANVRLVAALTVCLAGASALAAAPLKRVEIEEWPAAKEVVLGIGDLVESGAVQPVSAISVNAHKERCWTLRTPDGPKALRWPRPLLNAKLGAPDLTIDPDLRGSYDIYVQVRAVNQGGALGMDAKPDEGLFPMAFELALDDGSRRERVGAKGFPDYHYDTRVQACRRWQMDGRKIVLKNLGRPVYLYGFRFVPSKGSPGGEPRKVTRWLASDHVTIVKEPDKHFAFPGVALLKNDDLAVVYREGTRHGAEKIGKVSLSRSTDGGRTWLPRVTALDRPNRDDRDLTIFQMSDGTVLLLSSSCMCTSTDFGMTWSDPMPTPVFGPKGAVENEDGHIVYGGQERLMRQPITYFAGRPSWLNADSVYRTKDKGKTWRRVGIATHTLYIKGQTDYIWYDEPYMCVVPNRFWIFALRVDLDGFARIVRSSDRGKTWGPIARTRVWGYPQHLLPLRDGRLLMTYGYRRPPWGVRACLSRDDGRTWDIDNEIIIRMDGGTPEGRARKVWNSDLGYPVSVQLRDGSIFTVYYLNKDGSNCFIAGTFWRLPPAK